MSQRRRLLVYLDPGFIERGGHYPTFAKNIRAACVDRGIDLLHLVNSGVSQEVCREWGLHPVLSGSAYLADSQPQTDVTKVVRTVSRGLTRVVADIAGRSGRYDEIVYYMYTGHPAYISALAQALHAHGHGAATVSAHVVLFYLSDYFCAGDDDGRYADYLEAVADQLEVLDPHGRIHVDIDSDTAADRYARHFRRPVRALPFPQLKSARDIDPSWRLKVNKARPRVTYTGYPDAKFGFHLVLDLLERTNRDPVLASADYAVKLNPRIVEEPLMRRWRALREGRPDIEAHDGFLEHAAYIDLLQRTDVLLIPYGSQYNHDTSAVLVDGLVHGCVVVSAEPTWMSHVMRQHGSGLSYKPEDPDSLVATVTDAISRLPEHRARITRNLSAGLARFEVAGLMDRLFPASSAITGSSNTPTADAVQAAIAEGVIAPPPSPAQGPAMPKSSNPRTRKEKTVAPRPVDPARLLERLKGLDLDALPGGGKAADAATAEQLERIAAAWEAHGRTDQRFTSLRQLFSGRRCLLLGPDAALDRETLEAASADVVFAVQDAVFQPENADWRPQLAMVETRRFATDRKRQLSALADTVIVAPFHIADLLGGLDTLHVNHHPRPSYPDGYDFSVDASKITYTGPTATLTALQVAASLGFAEVLLVGVRIPDDPAEAEAYRRAFATAADAMSRTNTKLLELGTVATFPEIPAFMPEPFGALHRKALSALDKAEAGDEAAEGAEPDAADLARAEKLLLARHPTPADIYLPTSKYSGRQRLRAIQDVVDVWERGRERHKERLRHARDQVAKRDRCFIIGNGPSLNQTDLDLLADEVTFATNGIFMKFPETKFRPTFYVVEDHLVAEDRGEEIRNLSGFWKLAPFYLAYCLPDGPETIYYNHRSRISYPHGFDFSTNAEEITYTGCTVTFSCMQLAYYMGFKEIYLVGVDMSYVIPEQVKKAQEYDTEILDMEVEDPNHFAPNYFGRGYRWHDPNVDKMEEAYKEARRVTERHGVKIFNATVGGRCEVFDRVDYTSLFNGTPRIHPRPHPDETAAADTTTQDLPVWAGNQGPLLPSSSLERLVRLLQLNVLADPKVVAVGALDQATEDELADRGWIVRSLPSGSPLHAEPGERTPDILLVGDGSISALEQLPWDDLPAVVVLAYGPRIGAIASRTMTKLRELGYGFLQATGQDTGAELRFSLPSDESDVPFRGMVVGCRAEAATRALALLGSATSLRQDSRRLSALAGRLAIGWRRPA